MFKVVFNAFVFTCLAIAVYVFINRIPTIRDFRDCYTKAYTIINEAQSITRSSYVTEQEVCLEHKKVLIDAATCEQDVDSTADLSPKEWTILNNLGHLAAYGTLTMPELIKTHNQTCPGHPYQIQYDHRSQTWF